MNDHARTPAVDADVVLRDHAALIRRIARAHEANPARADDLAQDIAVAVWQALPRWRADASVRTFVARIAHNRAISHVANEMRLPRPVELDAAMPSDAASPDDVAARADLRRRLEAAVQRLPLGQKLVVTLALEGFAPDDIADVLGIGVSAAAVRLHRAKTALHDLLHGSDP